MYARFITARVGPRAMRANVGAYTMPIAIIAFVRLGPRMLVIAIARTIAGSENRMSIARISALSSEPP